MVHLLQRASVQDSRDDHLAGISTLAVSVQNSRKDFSSLAQNILHITNLHMHIHSYLDYTFLQRVQCTTHTHIYIYINYIIMIII